MVPLSHKHWLPATFRERGVAVPFTSPMLAGARIRLLERRADLVVPHPGGARGVYIFALGSLGEFCVPTLHDARLADRLGGLQAVSPQSVRMVARATAIEGAAGRQAAASAEAAARADTERRRGFEAALLRCGAPGGGPAVAGDGGAPLRGTLLDLATATGRAPEAVMADLGTLAWHLVAAGLDLPAGILASRPPGRCTQVLEMMADTARQIRAWTGLHAAEAGAGQAAAMGVAEALDAMAAAARLVHETMPALIDNPAGLLAQWAAAPEMLVQKIGRTDLLLDGWQLVCLLWHLAADDAARLEALLEAATVLPPFPPEGEGWIASRPDLVARLGRQAGATAAQRAGGRMPSQVVALVARNERMRALAA